MKQRVLIIRNAYQQDTGGAEQYAFNLALALKKSNLTPIVVTKHESIRNKCSQANIRSLKGVWKESQEWNRWYYLRNLLTSIWYAYIILRHRITVVHPQSRDDFVFATRAAHWLHRKVIWTDHADLKYVMDRINHPHPRMQSWILSAAKHATKITCVSKSEYESILSVAPELKDKLTVIYNGVFLPSKIRPVKKTNKLVIGTNARLVPAKGISEILEAFVDLKRKDIDLWFVGGYSGNEEKYKKKIAMLGITKQVRLFGYVANPNDYVASMDIFVHASYHEAFSLAIIEAAMLGRPIIATAVGGTPEIINESCGILVKPKNSHALKTALEALIQDTKRRQKLGEAAHQKAHKSYDFQKIVDNEIIPLYLGASE